MTACLAIVRIDFICHPSLILASAGLVQSRLAHRLYPMLGVLQGQGQSQAAIVA
jgi:hypothetical protein